MTPQHLIDLVFKRSYELHPQYSRHEHVIWVLGFIASMACDGIDSDNLVWQQAQLRLKQLAPKQAYK